MLLVVGWLGSQAQGWGVVWYGGGGTWAFSVQNQISAGGVLKSREVRNTNNIVSVTRRGEESCFYEANRKHLCCVSKLING